MSPELSVVLLFSSAMLCLQICLLRDFPLKHFIKGLFNLIHLLFVPPNEEGADKSTHNQEEAPRTF